MIEMRDPLKTEHPFFSLLNVDLKTITSSVIETGKNSTRFNLFTTNGGC